MNRRSEIQAFIQDLLRKAGDDRVLTDQDSLFESGRLQSIDAVDLVVFLEEKFAVDFSTIGFDRDRIDSIDAICTLAMIAA